MNLTDNEIIKALECCGRELDMQCEQCPLAGLTIGECTKEISINALNLINHLKKVINLSTQEIVDLKIKVKKQKAEIERLNKCHSKQILKINSDAKELAEIYQAKAIKKFWKKIKGIIKKHICFFTPEDESELIQYGDKLAKEMVGSKWANTYSRLQ